MPAAERARNGISIRGFASAAALVCMLLFPHGARAGGTCTAKGHVLFPQAYSFTLERGGAEVLTIAGSGTGGGEGQVVLAAGTLSRSFTALARQDGALEIRFGKAVSFTSFLEKNTEISFSWDGGLVTLPAAQAQLMLAQMDECGPPPVAIETLAPQPVQDAVFIPLPRRKPGAPHTASVAANGDMPWAFDRQMSERMGVCAITGRGTPGMFTFTLTHQQGRDTDIAIDGIVKSGSPFVLMAAMSAHGELRNYRAKSTFGDRVVISLGAESGWAQSFLAQPSSLTIAVAGQNLSFTDVQMRALGQAVNNCEAAAYGAAPAAAAEAAAPPAAVPQQDTAAENIPVQQEEPAAGAVTPAPLKPVAPAPATVPALNESVTISPLEPQAEIPAADDSAFDSEWAEKLELLEKENAALRARSKTDDSWQDIKVDPVSAIREKALEKKVYDLEEELQKLRTEMNTEPAAQESDKKSLPPPLPAGVLINNLLEPEKKNPEAGNSKDKSKN